jgi:SAM-dependent methyltransferase
VDDDLPFWEQSEQVERFAAREPDHRLAALAGDYADPGATRVLDIGCAGGRNTVFLAARGFDVHALDSSAAMVARTRARVAAEFGEAAASRVRRGTMDDLSAFAAASFHLVVALGVYHQAQSRGEFRRALEETARVLAPGGRVLVANFEPRTDPGGGGLVAVPGEPGLYTGFRADGAHTLLDAAELDREMGRVGLTPLVPTATVEVDTNPGRRVTVNGLYRKG